MFGVLNHLSLSLPHEVYFTHALTFYIPIFLLLIILKYQVIITDYLYTYIRVHTHAHIHFIYFWFFVLLSFQRFSVFYCHSKWKWKITYIFKGCTLQMYARVHIYILKTPKSVLSIGWFKAALKLRPITLRVLSGSMIPSSHRRPLA